METDPEKINDSDRYVESSILKAGEAYAASNKRQKQENKLRAENRQKVKDLGVGTYAYQVAVKICKDMTETERSDFLRDLEVLVRVLGPKQKDLFADELIKAEKREQKRLDALAKKNKTPEELDANPRSDPNAGGAKPQVTTGADEEAFIREQARKLNAEQEQAEGEAVLAKAPKSQSAIAAERRAAAGKVN